MEDVRVEGVQGVRPYHLEAATAQLPGANGAVVGGGDEADAGQEREVAHDVLVPRVALHAALALPQLDRAVGGGGQHAAVIKGQHAPHGGLVALERAQAGARLPDARRLVPRRRVKQVAARAHTRDHVGVPLEDPGRSAVLHVPLDDVLVVRARGDARADRRDGAHEVRVAQQRARAAEALGGLVPPQPHAHVSRASDHLPCGEHAHCAHVLLVAGQGGAELEVGVVLLHRFSHFLVRRACAGSVYVYVPSLAAAPSSWRGREGEKASYIQYKR